MRTFAQFATAAVAVAVVGVIGSAFLGPREASDRGSVSALEHIVVTEATVPLRLTVHRTLRGVDALRAAGVVPADVRGFVDAIETSFDGDADHEGDHEDLYRTFAAVFESAADAERAFYAAVAFHESADGWGLTPGNGRLERQVGLGLGDASIRWAQGADYGHPEIIVYLWRVDNMLLHAVDFHPYDRPTLLESIVRALDARARAG